MTPKDALRSTFIEMLKARHQYPPFHSYHEGYAIIKEELEELWTEIKKKPSTRDKEKLRKEAIQTAAMSLRFLVDLI